MEQKTGGIGLCGALFLIFVVFKLLGKITWSWWWITSPLWIPPVLILGFIAVLFIFGLIFGGFNGRQDL